MTPFGVRDKVSSQTIPVPCGKCPECVKRRTSGWSFRLMQEDKVAISSMFLTLTYDTTHVPLTSRGFMGLTKRDPQLFFKRLRKAHPKGTPIKYFLCGEYGGRTMRPHYHAIVFNADIKLVQPAWQYGSIHYGTVTGASIGYCLKYMMKKGQIPLHKNDDRLSEFALMSKGLGKNYLSDEMVRWHLADSDNRMHCTLVDGRKVSMPRYYKDKLFSDSNFPDAQIAVNVRKRAAFFQQWRMNEERVKAELNYEGDYFRDMAENHIAAFRRMEKESRKGDKL